MVELKNQWQVSPRTAVQPFQVFIQWLGIKHVNGTKILVLACSHNVKGWFSFISGMKAKNSNLYEWWFEAWMDPLGNFTWSARKPQCLSSFELPLVVSIFRQTTVQAMWGALFELTPGYTHLYSAGRTWTSVKWLLNRLFLAMIKHRDFGVISLAV